MASYGMYGNSRPGHEASGQGFGAGHWYGSTTSQPRCYEPSSYINYGGYGGGASGGYGSCGGPSSYGRMGSRNSSSGLVGAYGAYGGNGGYGGPGGHASWCSPRSYSSPQCGATWGN